MVFLCVVLFGLGALPVISPAFSEGVIASGMQSVLSDDTVPTTWNFTTNESWTKATISDDGSTVFVVSDNLLHRLDPSSNISLWTFNASENIFSLSTCENGSLTAVGTALGSGFVYLMGEDSNYSLWSYNASGWIVDIAISGDGSTIAAVDWSGWTYLFDYRSNNTLWKYKSPEPMWRVAISYDGNTIVSGGRNNTLYAFDRNSNNTLWTYDMGGWVNGLGINRDGSRIVGVSSERIYTFERTSNSTIWEYTGNDFITAEISADGSTIAVGTSSAVSRANLYLFEFSSNDTLWTFNGTNQITEIDMVSNGSIILAGGYDASAYLFRKDNNRTRLRIDMDGTIWQVGISEDGNRIVVGAENRTIYHHFERATASIAKLSGLYGPTDPLLIQANASRGTFHIWDAILYFRQDSGIWSNVTMQNTTSLFISQVTFAAEIGPFTEGVIEYYVSVGDALGVYVDSQREEARVDGSAPVCHSIEQLPQAPTSEDDVTVIANITDDIGVVDTVLLNYSVDSGTSWNIIIMQKGQNGNYSGDIPAQSNGTTVQYYILANDSVGNSQEFMDSGLYYQYVVYDPSTSTSNTTPPPTLTDTSQPTPEGDLLLVILVMGGISGSLAIVVLLVLRSRTTRTAPTSVLAGSPISDSGGRDRE